MESDIAGKSLEELRTFRNDLRRARDEYPWVCKLGRDPMGGCQSKVLAEYDDRIRAVSYTIFRLECIEREVAEKVKREKLEQERKLFEDAADAVAQLHSATDNIFYKSFSSEELKVELDRLSKIEQALRAKQEKLEEELGE